MQKTYCVIDQVEIPKERQIKRAVTCCDACRTKLKAIRRAHKEEKYCRQCARPSTPEERVLFARWRRETYPRPKKGRPKKAKPEGCASYAPSIGGIDEWMI